MQTVTRATKFVNTAQEEAASFSCVVICPRWHCAGCAYHLPPSSVPPPPPSISAAHREIKAKVQRSSRLAAEDAPTLDYVAHFSEKKVYLLRSNSGGASAEGFHGKYTVAVFLRSQFY